MNTCSLSMECTTTEYHLDCIVFLNKHDHHRHPCYYHYYYFRPQSAVDSLLEAAEVSCLLLINIHYASKRMQYELLHNDIILFFSFYRLEMIKS